MAEPHTAKEHVAVVNRPARGMLRSVVEGCGVAPPAAKAKCCWARHRHCYECSFGLLAAVAAAAAGRGAPSGGPSGGPSAEAAHAHTLVEPQARKQLSREAAPAYTHDELPGPVHAARSRLAEGEAAAAAAVSGEQRGGGERRAVSRAAAERSAIRGGWRQRAVWRGSGDSSPRRTAETPAAGKTSAGHALMLAGGGDRRRRRRRAAAL